ncbi:unnamed protein product, partial [Polarella glacialis]
MAAAAPIWPCVFHGSFVENFSLLKQEEGEAVRAVVEKMMQGRDWNLNGTPVRKSCSTSPAIHEQMHEESGFVLTTAIGTQRLVWWVELDVRLRRQALVIHHLLSDKQKLDERLQALQQFQATLSDKVVKFCPELGIVVVAAFLRRSLRLPVCLQKRFELHSFHLKELVRSAARTNFTAPYQLDEDEEVALRSIGNDVLFLLGRSGCGKTTVLTHAVCSLVQASSNHDFWEPTAMVLLTKAPKLADSIARLVQQLLNGMVLAGNLPPEAAIVTAPSLQGGMNQLLRNLPSLLAKDFDPARTGPLVLDFATFLRLLDASVDGQSFFQPPYATDAQAAIYRKRIAAGDVRTGGFQEDEEITYEFFIKSISPKLYPPLIRQDQPAVVFQDFLSVISGSLRAARSPTGTLTQSEYIDGITTCGECVPELKDSMFRDDHNARVRVWAAYEQYVEKKKELHRYDSSDPPRALLQRIRKFQTDNHTVPGIRHLAALLNDE